MDERLASDKEKILDSLRKHLTDGISSSETLHCDYSLSHVYNVLQPINPNAKFFLAKVHYVMENWSQAQFYAEEAIQILESPNTQRNGSLEKILKDMYYCKIRSALFLGLSDTVESGLSALEAKGPEYKTLFDRMQTMKNKMQSELQKYTRSELDQKDESESVFTLMEKFKLEPSQDYYIIPASWFRRWKSFIHFSSFVKEEEANQHSDFMEEELDFRAGPGPIFDEKLLDLPKGEDFPDLVLGTERKFADFSVNLKPGLVEDRDFFYANVRLFDFLHKRYNGLAIRRSAYISSPSVPRSISIEVYLKPINFLLNPMTPTIWPVDEQNLLKYKTRTYISKKCSIENLETIIINIIGLLFIRQGRSDRISIRLWKLDPCDNYNDYLKTLYNCETKPIELNAKLLFQEGVLLEDADISDEDLILVEIRQQDWVFKTPRVQDLKNEKKELVNNSGININTLVKHYDIDLWNKFVADSKYGLVGLQNLGNTCFMNSGLQCLMNSYQLTSYFLENKFVQDINVKNPLALKGLNAVTYAALVKEVFQGRKSCVSPWDLKRVISKYSSRFQGYSQQDSQELVSYLLDGLHEDLNRVIEKPTVPDVESKGRPDDIVAAESWEGHLKRNQSIIVDLFYGQFKSKITCPTSSCGKVSITFDPFQMVSVPVPCKELVKTQIYLVNQNLSLEKVTLSMNGTSSVAEVKRVLGKMKGTSEKGFETFSIQAFVIKERISDDRDLKYLNECPGIPFVYELPPLDSESCLLQVSIGLETSWFYESNKDISYPRMKYVRISSSLIDIHLDVFNLLKSHCKKSLESANGNGHSNGMQPFDYESKIYKEGFYKLSYLGGKREGKDKKKLGCQLCGKSSCKGCKVPYELSGTFARDLADEDGVIRLEVKFNKNVKKETLELNAHKELDSRNFTETLNVESSGLTIYDCLTQFIQSEKLEKGNEWYCSSCKDHKLATKKMDIYKTSHFLVIHLKRFKTSKVSSYGGYFGFGSSTKKINSLISFPLQGLDLSNYVLDKKSACLYDLYAVSNHYGGLEGGHYTAYCRNEFDEKWYEFDDSHVRKLNEKDVVSAAAYILFYKRREPKLNN